MALLIRVLYKICMIIIIIIISTPAICDSCLNNDKSESSDDHLTVQLIIIMDKSDNIQKE